MTLDHRLIAMLVCPLCKGPLDAGHDAQGRLVELECPADKWSTDVCKGPKHCSMDSDGAFCDRTRADVGDACASRSIG